MGILETMDAKLDLILAKLNAGTPIEPPVIEPPIVIPPIIIPPTPDVIDYTEQFYKDIAEKSVISLIAGKTYVVNTLQKFVLTKDLEFKVVGEGRANILIGKKNHKPWEGGESWEVFQPVGNVTFKSKGVNWCIPEQLNTPQRYIPTLFSSDRNPNSRITILIEDCDTTVFGRNGGMGLGQLFGSTLETHAALINFKHAGGRLMDLKNPDLNSVMYLTLENVETDYLNPDEFNNDYIDCKIKFTTDFSGFKINGQYGSHCAEIKEPDSFYPIANQFYNRGWNNRLIMIHIDRFVFWLPSTQFLQKMVDPILGNTTDWQPNDNSTLANIGNKILLNQIAREGDIVDLVRDYWFDENGNKTQASDRYGNPTNRQIRSFPNRLLDPISNYPIELQPGDKLKIEGVEYKIVLKERGNNWHIDHEWRTVTSNENGINGQEAQYVYSVLTLDKDLPDGIDSFASEVIYSSAEYLLDGNWQTAVVVSKGNSQIDLQVTDKFKDTQVMHRQNAPYHLCYNHGGEKGISLWMKDTKLNGFYRQSENGGGKSLGYNIVNSEVMKSEFSPLEPVTTDKPMPERIKQLRS